MMRWTVPPQLYLQTSGKVRVAPIGFGSRDGIRMGVELGEIPIQLRESERLIDNALGGEGGVTMDDDWEAPVNEARGV